MTFGQETALKQLERIRAARPDILEIIDDPEQVENLICLRISIRIGMVEKKPGGLDFREREKFILCIPEDFPFAIPRLMVSHNRFGGFPHVIWTKTICLYQRNYGWNPADGLYGFFDRLSSWMTRAAMNEMDPIDVPLEPPHHITDFHQKPFVVRADAPCRPGVGWIGCAVLQENKNCFEIIRWFDPLEEAPQKERVALAIILPRPLPLEFPEKGDALFNALIKAGLSGTKIMKNLALAALLTPVGHPIHLVLGLPMRRSALGEPRLHFAIWSTTVDKGDTLRNTLPKSTDTKEIIKLRSELQQQLESVFANTTIKWCKVLEERPEIVERRDKDTPLQWFTGKRIAVLGCGAIGSWLAEIIARSRPSSIVLVDNSIVQPGVLSRQNFERRDIGLSKSQALKRRLKALNAELKIVSNQKDAHIFLFNSDNLLTDYDVIFDCTASPIFQMKLERDWSTLGMNIPPFISMIVDSLCAHCLCVITKYGAPFGIWHEYLSLKWKLCIREDQEQITEAFYAERPNAALFQPESGCSDPTFIGSTADIMSFVSTIINLLASQLITGKHENLALTKATPSIPAQIIYSESTGFTQAILKDYNIRIAHHVITQAHSWVKQKLAATVTLT